MKKLKLTALLLCFTLLLAACSEPQADTPAEIEDTTAYLSPICPDTGEKIIGSRFFRENFSYSFYPTSFEDLVFGAQYYECKIIIGRVESVADVWELHRVPAEAIAEGAHPYHDDITDYNIIVSEILYGEGVDSRIILSLQGFPDCHNRSTKPNIGDTLLLFVWPWFEGRFTIAFWEESMFKINDDGTLYSFSDAEFTARFDGLPLEALTREINTAWEMARDVVPPWADSQ